MSNLVIGSVVFSKKGRDSGSYYMVFECINEDYVLIVDGRKRKLINPKLKKIKHLKNSGKILESIAEKIILSKQIFDQEIYKALREFNQDI